MHSTGSTQLHGRLGKKSDESSLFVGKEAPSDKQIVIELIAEKQDLLFFSNDCNVRKEIFGQEPL